jgi:hypothetical protein
MSVVHKFTKVLPVIPRGKAIYIFAWVGVDGSQLAVFVAFHGGLRCENLVYLFIFKHL